MSLINLGTVTNRATASDSVGFFDPIDVINFNIATGGRLNLSLTGLSADADVQLFRGSSLIASSARGGTTPDSINLSGAEVTPGDYTVRVFQGNFLANTNYNFGVSINNPSEFLADEANLGNLGAAPITQTGFVGNNDTSDIYQFSLASARTLSASLSGLSADADLRIIRDANSNGIADAGDEIIRSAFGGNTSESITQFLAAGNYFAQVYQFGGETSYNLGLSAV